MLMCHCPLKIAEGAKLLKVIGLFDVWELRRAHNDALIISL